MKTTNNSLNLFLVAISFLCIPNLIFATSWTGASDGVSWNDSANWDAGLPSSSVDAVIPDVASGILGVGDGINAAAKSISVSSGSSAFSIAAAGPEVLNLYGNFTNSSASAIDVLLDTTFLANSVLDGPISFSGTANVDLRVLTITEAISFSSNVNLQLNSVSSYGRMNLTSGSSINLTNATISFTLASTYAGNSGDVFQIVDKSAGSWSGVSGATLATGTLPTLTGGLTWNTSNFTTDGSISVVPEPTTWGLLACALTAVLVRRKRREARGQ